MSESPGWEFCVPCGREARKMLDYQRAHLKQEVAQRCLDIVHGNFDTRKPTDDLTEIIARIVTDIQALP